MSTERPFVNRAGADPRLDPFLLRYDGANGASVAGRPVAKPLQLGLQRSDSRLGSSAGLRLSLHPRLGKGGASFGFGSRTGFGLQGLADRRVVAKISSPVAGSKQARRS